MFASLARRLALPSLAVTLALGAAPAAAEKIVVVSHGQANDPFWTVVKNAVERAGADLGVDVEYRAPETFDMVAMAQLVEAAVQQEPDGLVVSVPDADALGGAVRRAVAAGIPVVSMNSGGDVAAELGVLLHVGQDERDAGVGAGRRLRELGVRHPVCVNHEVGNVALDLRAQGVRDGFGGDVPVLPTAANTVEDVYAKVKAALQADPTIDAVMTLGGSNAAEPALKAIGELGRTDVRLATFDLSPEILEAVRDGRIAFAVDQQQFLQGYLPVLHLTLWLRYRVLPAEAHIPTGPGFVTRENAADVIALSERGLR
jgi:simple sugar transport system substrate-binding protein